MFNQKERALFYSIYWLALVLLLLLVQTSPAIAKPVEVGRVLMATLGVTAETSTTDSRALTRRSAIFVGDTLKTPAGGRAQLRMADGEMISLMESSELFIEDFKYNSDETNNETNTNVKNLVTGGLRVITGAVKGKNYEMKSRAGTIGIRGTSFEAFTQQGENLYVRMLSGRVYVRNQQGSIEIGFNQPLSAVRVARFNSPPEAILPTQLPDFFENAFSAGTNLSRSGDQPRFSAIQLGLGDNPLALQGNQSQEQNQQPAASQLGLNDNLQATNEQLAREQVAREQAAREQAAREQAAREQAAREQAAREQAEQEASQPTVEPIGSFGYVFAQKPSQAYGGGFVGMPENPQESVGVRVVGSNGIALADPSIALINSFDFLIGTRLVELPYSTIYVGNTSMGSGPVFKINSEEELLSDGGFIYATNVHNTIDTLPTLDHDYTYSLLSGVLEANGLDAGYMQVNFSTGDMSVSLDSSGYGIYTGQDKVAQFYNDFISLKNTSNEMLNGSITGRFVGPDAEGAITFYSLDSGAIDPITGVGVFDRGVNTPPP